MRATEIDFGDLVDTFSEIKTNKEASLSWWLHITKTTPMLIMDM